MCVAHIQVRLLKSHGAIMDPVSGEKTLKEVANRVRYSSFSVSIRESTSTLRFTGIIQCCKRRLE